MNVLVAYERSQVITQQFRERGHQAYSCDLLPSYGNLPQYHIINDAHVVMKEGFWDLIIMHPPCTFTCLSGNGYYAGSNERRQAIAYIIETWTLACNCSPRVCLEQPKSVLSKYIGKPSQVIHPWQFGHPEKKETWLWLRRLPRIKPTNIVRERSLRLTNYPKSKERSAIRSQTFKGIAEAMSSQWGILNAIRGVAHDKNPFLQLSLFN